jgi:3-oxoacyl-[acyl-carrier protein] reductase
MTTQTNRVAIVTGSSKGIGAAIARRLAQDGIAVVVNYISNQTAAAGVVADITTQGGQAIAVQADVANKVGISSLFDAAEAAFGGVDILVNNAAAMGNAPIAEADDALFQTLIETNVGGVFRGMREAGRRLRDGGRIINFSSSVVGLYQPTYSLYAASKAAVEAMTHVVAKELGPRRITVNAIAPGPVETDMFLNGKSEALVESIIKMHPQQRLGQPTDIAGLAAFLASPEGAWVSGQTIRANGGTV